MVKSCTASCKIIVPANPAPGKLKTWVFYVLIDVRLYDVGTASS